MEVESYKGQVPPEELATFISRCFLASAVFGSLEPDRYSPGAVLEQLKRPESFVAVDTDIVGSISYFPPDPASPCDLFRFLPAFGLLAVDPACRGKGIARLLINHIEDFALGQGFQQIALSVTERGAELIRLYKRLGYQQVGNFHWRGARDSSCIMCKRLDSSDRLLR